MRILGLLGILWTLSGCAEIRHMTMTKDELRLYGQLEVSPCLDPTVVCIVEN